ncbi:hypothetical protein G3480_12580 [Thiorhodococcus mannitoliphagus]|uniref:Large ribosomal RNA subunit accumulation protein YceD n=1 Tax=Thiorhodococcus mannitoliphagus TaxID=329406 RepID=A0A6P1DSR6_9GAMM|nr:YceD family protein [Thiorhodococcus mannitoliphagus]NEX21138.1 hypothetical protein [Thiorhodococcus mannitoliphagus]
MSPTLPDQLDPWRAVKSGVHLSGALPLHMLPRLSAELAVSASDVVHYELLFERDPEGRAVVRGRLKSSLRLRCQRCLGEVLVPVDVPLGLVLLPSEHGAADLPPDLDPWVVGDDLVCPRDLVEDELLLAIPVVPRHAPGDCQAPPARAEDQIRDGGDSDENRPNPFAALAELKGQGRSGS